MLGDKKQEKKENSRKLDGSYTVEAAVIVPLTVWVVVLLMFGAFYEYNVCTMWQGAYTAALRGEIQGGESARKKQAAQEKIMYDLQNELWMTENQEYEVWAGRGSIQTQIRADLRVPADRELFRTLWRLEAKGVADRIRPVTFIRACNKAEDIKQWLQKGSERE